MSASMNPTTHLSDMRKDGQKLVEELKAANAKKPAARDTARGMIGHLLNLFHKLDTGKGTPRQWAEVSANEQIALAGDEPTTKLLEEIRTVALQLEKMLENANKKEPAAPGSMRARAAKWIEMLQDLDQVLSEGGDAPGQWSGGEG